MASLPQQPTKHSGVISIYKLPVKGTPSLVELPLFYDPKNPGPRICEPYSDDKYGITVFSGLFPTTEWLSLHSDQVTPSVEPSTLPGFWKDSCEDPDIQSRWEIAYSLLADENGRYSQKPNENIKGLFGPAYVVKQWHRSDPATEAPISLDTADIPLIQERLGILAKTTFCTSIQAMNNAYVDMRQYHIPEFQKLFHKSLDEFCDVKRDTLTNKPYFVGVTEYERMGQLNVFLKSLQKNICLAYPMTGSSIPLKQYKLKGTSNGAE